MNKKFTSERYNRQIILPQIGEEGQKKLLNARVLVVGAGGLGAPVLQYLTAAGVGYIGIVDADVVSISNLQRQVLFRENQLGQLKTEKAAETLTILNSDCCIETYSVNLSDENAEKIITQYDIVVGATDSFASRRLIDRVCKHLGKTFVHGSVSEFYGQVAVFNYRGSASYADLFSDYPEDNTLPSGVIGVLPAVIGSLQAAEVIKIILGIGDILANKLLIYDVLTVNFTIVEY
ncbi:MAG: HesA/MoeB/ThiF family protein [Prevotellaceae bacterium]|nr:HesA/MoeB/ThiF family protein [Prevotellaceae bacterium]